MKQDTFTSYADIDLLEYHKVYSPMFDTTFDLLTPEQQKAQLDLWVEDGSFNDMTNYPFKKKTTREQREKNFNNYVKGRRR